ncbi:MAG TPA: GNAT family N-acetyltransferase [Anaerolineae bacterium]
MLDHNEKALQQSLSGNFVMRTAANETDVERVAQFNGVIHGHGVIAMTRNLFLHHPATRGRDLIFIEDTTTGEVVSSLCVIPWQLSYVGALINSGEMGIVGTLKEYRNRGLVREQVKFFRQRLVERGCVMSHIQGIAYYYRQFDYEYAMPLEGGYVITSRELSKIPAQQIELRLAATSDMECLQALADQANTSLHIHSVRDAAIWKYLATQSIGTETESEVWVILDGSNGIVSYVRLPKNHFGEELTVSEAADMTFDQAIAVRHFLTRLAEERKTSGVRLCLPLNHPLMRVAKSLGARDIGQYAWQVCLPDIPAFLRAIGPALEKRIAQSIFAGFTHTVPICFYRQSVNLHFENGRLKHVEDVGFTDGGPIRFPSRSFTPLVLGYRSLEETLKAYPDAGVSPVYRLLIETLFPTTYSFLYTIY